MKYYAYHIELQPAIPWVEVALGLLSEGPFSTIEESATGVSCYSDKSWSSENKSEFKSTIKSLNPQLKIRITEEEIPWKNWNEEWEKSFEPIFIEDWCAIYASFHKDVKEYPITLRINPKMSFGTGHHQTTALMLQQMKSLDFNNRSLLDMGCGTGVLAIVAKKLGARKVEAVDIEPWSVENAIENMELNNVSLDVKEGEQVPKNKYDILLANINKNVLIAQGQDYYNQLTEKGDLVLSGILSTDFEEVKEYFESLGFTFISELKKDNWICLRFCKNS